MNEANAKAMSLLQRAAGELRGMLEDEMFMTETPLEVDAAMQAALDSVEEAMGLLGPAGAGRPATGRSHADAPTRQQGQFLAFIREYMMRNEGGVAPSHADLQRFFNLRAPSVNSMLVRLERRGFIRRVPRKARAIELTVSPELIPPLERPFKF